MAEEKEETTPVTLDEFFSNIIRLHGKPVFVLMKINEDNTFSLQAAAGTEEGIGIVTDKQKSETPPYYTG